MSSFIKPVSYMSEVYYYQNRLLTYGHYNHHTLYIARPSESDLDNSSHEKYHTEASFGRAFSISQCCLPIYPLAGTAGCIHNISCCILNRAMPNKNDKETNEKLNRKFIHFAVTDCCLGIRSILSSLSMAFLSFCGCGVNCLASIRDKEVNCKFYIHTQKTIPQQPLENIEFALSYDSIYNLNISNVRSCIYNTCVCLSHNDQDLDMTETYFRHGIQIPDKMITKIVRNSLKDFLNRSEPKYFSVDKLERLIKDSRLRFCGLDSSRLALIYMNIVCLWCNSPNLSDPKSMETRLLLIFLRNGFTSHAATHTDFASIFEETNKMNFVEQISKKIPDKNLSTIEQRRDCFKALVEMVTKEFTDQFEPHLPPVISTLVMSYLQYTPEVPMQNNPGPEDQSMNDEMEENTFENEELSESKTKLDSDFDI